MDATEIACVDRKAPRLQPRPSGRLQSAFNSSLAQVRLECGETRQRGPSQDVLSLRPGLYGMQPRSLAKTAVG